MSVKLPFGLRLGDNRFVDAKSVLNGKACGCICPVCREALVAKNGGREKIAHFAHRVNCPTAYESALHETAKQIIRDLGFIWLPGSEAAPAQILKFTGHTLEKRYDRLIPDVTVWKSADHKLAVEIFVTHAVTNEKEETLRKLQLSCVEFDLSTLPRDMTYDRLKAEFENNRILARWVFNRKTHAAEIRRAAEERRQKAAMVAHKHKVMEQARKGAIERPVYRRVNRRSYTIFHVDPCPKGARVSGGAQIANVNLDCSNCDFCFGIRWKTEVPQTVTCGGHLAYMSNDLGATILPKSNGPLLPGLTP